MPFSSQIHLGFTYGAELLAAFASTALWGMTCMQALMYFIRYPRDDLHLKLLVLWLWIADTTHEVLIVKGVYDSLIVYFCDLDRIEAVVPEFLWQVLITSLVSISAQTFFTSRIWRFSGRRWFYWAILLPVCSFELGGAIAFIAFGTTVSTAAELVSPSSAAIYIAIQAAEAATDLTIATCLVLLLIKSRERALECSCSRTILQKLLVLTINTGVWTALFATLTFVSILACKNTLIYAALYFPLCPLYSNTVLANLNARDLLRARSSAVTVVDRGTTHHHPHHPHLPPNHRSHTDACHVGHVYVGPRSRVGVVPLAPKLTLHVEVNASVKRDDDDD